MTYGESSPTRREFLEIALVAPATIAVARVAAAQPRGGPTPTPVCGEAGVTPLQTEGPFFKPRSPLRTSLLEPSMTGARIVVRGRVLTTECKPIAGALLDFWQADDRGEYDNTGNRMRGHQFTDAEGRFTLETLVPAVYPGRTRHIHVKVQAPNQPVLTTQLYFPGEPENQRDPIFSAVLVMKVEAAPGGRIGTFDFVLDDQLRGNRARLRG
jgi:protocatechuate 3,4-dioxygenase beta subunit